MSGRKIMSRICTCCGQENMDDSLTRCDLCGQPLAPINSSNSPGTSGSNNQQSVGYFRTDRRVWPDKASAVCAVLIVATVIYFLWKYYLQGLIDYYFF